MHRLLPLLLFLGCQEPFTTDRHDLVGFRIAAMGTEGGVARAAVWSGLGPWHEQAPTLRWSLDGEDLGEGFAVVVPGPGTLSLTATAPDGEERLGEVTAQQALPALSVSRQEVVLGEALSLEDRLALEGTSIEGSASPGAAVRLTLDGLTEEATARWMSAGGTVLELERDTADFLAEEIVLDDGVLEERTALSAGTYPMLGLAIDGTGSSRWLWMDAAVGEERPLVRHGGRLIPADAVADVSTGLIAVTLTADARPGVLLTDTVPVTDTTEQDALPCAPSAPFLLDWIVEGRCPRPDVLGARVVLEVW